MMIKYNRQLTVGDHIPYIITEPLDGGDPKKSSKTAADRARHPYEIARSGGVLKPDIEWYLTQQILPPVGRLCEPIEGLSPGLIAERLGLDSAKYIQRRSMDVSSFVANEIAAESKSAVSPASADLESYICKDDENV
eukprot:scaffold1159_cov71-Cylindrotheca_fusiformis.AAC.1